METKEAIINNYNHSITITERKNLLITGVKKIENFDNEEFLLETVMGFLAVKGEDLELVKLDTLAGNISIKGLIKGFSYIDEDQKKEKGTNSVFNRLFK
ncbi:MAG TPA: sporulation protein YabP [Candidatus Onthousia faecavium]|nr:sporulation protein YabP [Candidatus Onthousia faecavium]